MWRVMELILDMLLDKFPFRAQRHFLKWRTWILCAHQLRKLRITGSLSTIAKSDFVSLSIG
jgi:hypothetical protein